MPRALRRRATGTEGGEDELTLSIADGSLPAQFRRRGARSWARSMPRHFQRLAANGVTLEMRLEGDRVVGATVTRTRIASSDTSASRRPSHDERDCWSSLLLWPGLAARAELAVLPRSERVRSGAGPPDRDHVGRDEGSGILWKTEIPGLAVSSPIVWGDTVFVTTAVSSDPKAVFRHGLYGDVEPSNDVSKHSWRVLALDKRDGPDPVGARRARGRAEDQAPSEVQPGLVHAGHRRAGRGRLVRVGGPLRLRHEGQARSGSRTSGGSTPAGSSIPTTSGAPPARPSSTRTS